MQSVEKLFPQTQLNMTLFKQTGDVDQKRNKRWHRTVKFSITRV